MGGGLTAFLPRKIISGRGIHPTLTTGRKKLRKSTATVNSELKKLLDEVLEMNEGVKSGFGAEGICTCVQKFF
jgi:hypothetical protein